MQGKALNDRLKNFFEEDEKNNKKLFSELSLYIYQLESPDSDLHILASLLSEKDLNNLINYYDGDTLKMPTQEEYYECIFLAICFYLKEIKNMSWKDIKKFINLPEANTDMLNPIMIGRKINNIKVKMNKHFKNILQKIKFDEKEIHNFLKEVQKK